MMVVHSRKRVRFDGEQVAVIPRRKDDDVMTDDETKELDEHERRRKRKRVLWYSREEMAPARDEAKEIIRMIHSVGGDIEKIDHSKVCVIGLEKFHNGHENEQCRRLLIRSILVRQQMNKSMKVDVDDASQSLVDISTLLSKSFVEFALWQGALNTAHAYGTVNPTTTATPLTAVADDKNSPSPAATEPEPRSIAAVCWSHDAFYFEETVTTVHSIKTMNIVTPFDSVYREIFLADLRSASSSKWPVPPMDVNPLDDYSPHPPTNFSWC